MSTKEQSLSPEPPSTGAVADDERVPIAYTLHYGGWQPVYGKAGVPVLSPDPCPKCGHRHAPAPIPCPGAAAVALEPTPPDPG